LRARGPQTVLVKRYVPKLGQFGEGGVVVTSMENKITNVDSDGPGVEVGR